MSNIVQAMQTRQRELAKKIILALKVALTSAPKYCRFGRTVSSIEVCPEITIANLGCFCGPEASLAVQVLYGGKVNHVACGARVCVLHPWWRRIRVGNYSIGDDTILVLYKWPADPKGEKSLEWEIKVVKRTDHANPSVGYLRIEGDRIEVNTHEAVAPLVLALRDMITSVWPLRIVRTGKKIITALEVSGKTGWLSLSQLDADYAVSVRPEQSRVVVGEGRGRKRLQHMRFLFKNVKGFEVCGNRIVLTLKHSEREGWHSEHDLGSFEPDLSVAATEWVAKANAALAQDSSHKPTASAEKGASQDD